MATVRNAFKDRTSDSRLNGQDNVTLSVTKRGEATRPKLAFIVDRRKAMLQGVNTATIGMIPMAVGGNPRDLINERADPKA